MYGGRIYAKSLPEKTSFIVVLPSYELKTDNDKDDLIHHTREIRPTLRTPVRHSCHLDCFYKLHQMRGKSSSLLIVDDEPIYRESLRTMIDRIVEIRDILRVVEASDGENALALFEKENFDYVVSDIDMGKNKMNGYTFVRELLSKHKNVIAVIHSNKRQSEMYEALRNIPRMQGFLPKPMNREDILVFLSGDRMADCNSQSHHTSGKAGGL
jgi:CheY-like chemotaxis protein